MKIKASILAAATLVLALAACQKEQEQVATNYHDDPNAVIVLATLQQPGEADGTASTASTSASTASIGTASTGTASTSASTTLQQPGTATGTTSATTRANTESTGDAFVINEDRFWVINTTPNPAAGTNNQAQYTYTAPDTWTLTNPFGGTNLEAPYLTWAEGDNTFEAYMPVGETTTTYATFTLPPTQTDVDKLRAADWMTATATKARTDQDRTVSLRFTHRLAKVTVSITAYRNEFGTTPPTISAMRFKLPTVDLAPGVTLPAAQTVAPLITPDPDPSTAHHSYTAILAPGKYAAGADFLTMSIDDQPVTVKVNDLLATTGLLPGKSYTFQLTVGNHIATLTSFTVGDWTAGNPLDATNNPGLVLAPNTGTNNAPIYEIHSAQGLKAFADIINGTDDGTDRIFCGIKIPGTPAEDASKSNARLMADIDLSTLCGPTIGTDGKGKSWTPIGKTSGNYSYKGVFEGNHHTVKGLYIDDTRTGFDTGTSDGNSIYQGLFGFVAGATVQRLTVTGSVNLSITAAQGTVGLYLYAGGITGGATGSTLTDCHSEVSVSAEGDEAAVNTTVRAGGIAGSAANSGSGGISGSLNDCTSTGAVTATASTTNSSQEVAFVGGICGNSIGTPLTGCSHTTSAVSATAPKGSAYAGGVVGQAANSGQLLGCTNTAAVSGLATDATTGSLNIGGVAGQSNAEVVACSNSGAITFNAGGELYAGGVVGYSQKAIVASFSTHVPTAGQGGGNGAEEQSYIGGILGFLNSTTAPVSTCFYVGSSELGINGVGFAPAGVVGFGRITNTDGGIIPTSAKLNDRVKQMNDAIDTYNTGAFSENATVPAITCPYRWTKTAAEPKVRR